MNSAKNIAILGMGLLGGSLALSAKKNIKGAKISVWSRSKSSREKAKRLADIVCETPAECVKNADIVVICTNPSTIAKYAAEILPHLKENAVVSDVASIKGAICKAVDKIYKGKKAYYVGSHPMAGSDKSGSQWASADLFDNRPCMVIPSKNRQATLFVEDFWKSLKMRVKFMTAQAHDLCVARISHLPHITAAILCKNAKGKNERFALSTGFKDTTRIAGGNPVLWTDIISENKSSILKALRCQIKEFENFEKLLKSGNAKAIKKFLASSQKFRESL